MGMVWRGAVGVGGWGCMCEQQRVGLEVDVGWQRCGHGQEKSGCKSKASECGGLTEAKLGLA